MTVSNFCSSADRSAVLYGKWLSAEYTNWFASPDCPKYSDTAVNQYGPRNTCS
jgi:hypothetical protein